MGSIVPLQDLCKRSSSRTGSPGTPDTRCASGACASERGEDALSAEARNRIHDHPCYSEEAHHYYARMHVAVAPACNIQCHYCNRKFDCANESRPGVVSEKLTPEQAADKVLVVATRVPQLSVLGIAGPGDACCNFESVRRTFDLVRARIPDLKLCVSTNGLGLLDCVDDLVRLNVTHVTITINMVDPEVGQHIYPWIYFRHRRWTGLDASKILHERQMAGLDALVSRNVLVKVNSVLIPGINDEHLVEVNRVVRNRGAFLHNVTPLISDAAHGTHFGVTGQREPTHEELSSLRDRLGVGARTMRHCRQCRADAVGMLGEDLGSQFTMDRLGETPSYDPTARAAYRAVAERERFEHQEAQRAAREELRAVSAGPTVLVGVTSRGGARINEHFGHAKELHVFEVSRLGVRFVGQRKIPVYCQGGWGDDEALEGIVDALRGIRAVLCARVGACPKDALAAAGTEISDAYARMWLESGVVAWYVAKFGKARLEESA